MLQCLTASMIHSLIQGPPTSAKVRQKGARARNNFGGPSPTAQPPLLSPISHGTNRPFCGLIRQYRFRRTCRMAQRYYYLSTMALALLWAAPAHAAAPVPQPLHLQIQGGGIIVLDFPPEPANLPPLPIVNDGFANDQDVPGPLTPLITALRSQNYPEREAATRALLRLPPNRLNDVVDALAKEADSEAIA